MSNSFYREIINEHNLRPVHKHILPRAGLSHRGVNPSCGDDITLQLTIQDGVISEGAFSGNGCAISQASADMMLDLIIGRTPEEARHLTDLFLRMIKRRAGRTGGSREPAGHLPHACEGQVCRAGVAHVGEDIG